MATNVYRAEERIWFGGEPCRTQGYCISTSCDMVTHTYDGDTWKIESKIRKLFPNSDAIRVSGFLLIACHGPEDWRDFASEKLLAELQEDGFTIDDDFDKHGILDSMLEEISEQQATLNEGERKCGHLTES